MKKLEDYKVKIAIMFGVAFFIIAVIGLIVVNGADFKRWKKTFQSNYEGGLERTITLYDSHGNIIKQWHGKFDVQTSEARVFFDTEEGKRVIIYNGTVVNEED